MGWWVGQMMMMIGVLGRVKWVRQRRGFETEGCSRVWCEYEVILMAGIGLMVLSAIED